MMVRQSAFTPKFSRQVRRPPLATAIGLLLVAGLLIPAGRVQAADGMPAGMARAQPAVRAPVATRPAKADAVRLETVRPEAARSDAATPEAAVKVADRSVSRGADRAQGMASSALTQHGEQDGLIGRPALGQGNAVDIGSVDPLDDLVNGLMTQSGDGPVAPASVDTLADDSMVEGRSRLSQSRSITQVIESVGIRPDQYGLDIRPLGKGSLRASHEPARPMNPASTMKLVTTYASLALLGPDYRWSTDLFLDGRRDGDVLNGNLIVRGGGDPKLVIEDLTEMLSRLRQAGIREIRGDIVVDDGLYAASPDRFEAFDGDSTQPYNVRPYAALMNFKATRFTIDPRTRSVTMDPPLAGVRVENRVRVLNGRCRPTGTRFNVDDDQGTPYRPVIQITGTQVRGCGEQFFYAAVLSHRQFVAGLLKAGWKDAGGTLTGTVRVKAGAAKGEPFLRWESPRTLADVVRDVNKYSNNVMAQMLMLQVGAHNRVASKSPVTVDEARRVLRDWYASQGMDMRSLVVENGSGLSRIERISPSDLTRLLDHAAQSPLAAGFEDSLPKVGIDGTMRTRLRRDPIAGQAFIKTGTLRDVRAIAGYVVAASGERYAVALLINGLQAEGAGKAQDALLRWVYQNG